MKKIFLQSNNDSSYIRSVFSRFFISSMLAIFLNNIGSIVSNIIVGNAIDTERLAVMSLILPVYYIFTTVGNMMGIGGSVLCGRYIGQRKDDDCKKAFTVTYIFTLLVTVFLSVILLCFLPQVVSLLGTPKSLISDVTDYLSVMIAGGFFLACVYLSFNFLRLDSRNVATTLTFVLSAVFTISFDILLTLLFHLDLFGIALATILGSFAASVFGLLVLQKKSTLLKLHKVSFREFIYYVKLLCKYGSPGATENISILLRSYIYNRLIVSFSSTGTLSLLSIVNSVDAFASSIIYGAAGAISPLISVFTAENDTAEIKRTLRVSLFLSGICLIIVFTPVSFLCNYVVTWFGINPSATDFTACVNAIRIYCISRPFALVANMFVFYHISNGRTIVSNVLTFLRNLFLPVCTAYLLMMIWGQTGLWISFTLYEALTVLSCAIIHLFYKKKHPELSYVLLLNNEAERTGKVFRFVINDCSSELEGTMDSLSQFCETNHLNRKQTLLITLAMEEMLVLIEEHSLKENENKQISIRVALFEDSIILRIRNRGDFFNPLDYYDSSMSSQNDVDSFLDLDDKLGIKMVLNTCKNIDYRTTFGINNLTIII